MQILIDHLCGVIIRAYKLRVIRIYFKKETSKCVKTNNIKCHVHSTLKFRHSKFLMTKQLGGIHKLISNRGMKA